MLDPVSWRPTDRLAICRINCRRFVRHLPGEMIPSISRGFTPSTQSPWANCGSLGLQPLLIASKLDAIIPHRDERIADSIPSKRCVKL
jgi:hypothetical protein